MNKILLTAVSAIAITAATPAFAGTQVNTQTSAEVETERTQNQGDVPTVTEQDVQDGWEKTKKAVSNTAEDVSEASQDAYENIKASVIGDDQTTGVEDVTIDSRMTASGMIGETIYNANGDAVADVSDIILDADGNPIMVVVSNAEFIGVGKKAAFDYNLITKRNAEGDIIAPLTEETIDKAMEFSYDRTNQSESIKVIPSGGYSVAELLDGEVIDQNGETIAEVDNISFGNGQAEQIIVAFDKVLGLGGKKAALSFDSATLVRNGNRYDFQLNAEQAAQFEAYKKSTKSE